MNLDHWFSAEGVNEEASENLMNTLNGEALCPSQTKRWEMGNHLL